MYFGYQDAATIVIIVKILKHGIPKVEFCLMTMQKKEIFEQLEKDYISGITFSGGDPLYKNNLNDLYELIIDIKSKFPEKTIWLYTGYTWESIFFLSMEHGDIMRVMIVLLCDVIVDGEYVDHLRDVSLHWRGSSNQRVIDVKESLLKFDRKNIHSEIALWE